MLVELLLLLSSWLLSSQLLIILQNASCIFCDTTDTSSYKQQELLRRKQTQDKNRLSQLVAALHCRLIKIVCSFSLDESERVKKPRVIDYIFYLGNLNIEKVDRYISHYFLVQILTTKISCKWLLYIFVMFVGAHYVIY